MFRTNICDTSATNEYESLQTAGADSPNQIPAHTCDSYTSLDKYLAPHRQNKFFLFKTLRMLCDIYSGASKIFILLRSDILYRFTISQLHSRIEIDTQRHNIFFVHHFVTIVYFSRIGHLTFYTYIFIFVFYIPSIFFIFFAIIHV